MLQTHSEMDIIDKEGSVDHSETLQEGDSRLRSHTSRISGQSAASLPTRLQVSLL